MAATKNVPATKGKVPGTAVGKATSWQERMAAMAQEAVKTEESVSSGNFFSFKSGVLSYGGNAIPGNKIDVIVIDSILENCYFGSRYDPDSPGSPVCYAFARTDEELAPHEKSAEPQHETCKGCPMNEYETADNGKGKACKNVRRLAVIPGAPLDEESIEKAEVAYMKLPVTSVKGWASYVRSLSALEGLPPLGVVTTVSVAPDAKTQFKVSFNKVENIDADLMDAVVARHDGVKDSIGFPYPEPRAEEKPAKKPAGKRKY